MQKLKTFLIIAISGFLALSFCPLWSQMANPVKANRIIDGDTFVLETGEKVRLIGIDCPESQDPNKPVEYFSGQAKEYLRRLIDGKELRLEYGEERTDKYRRLLCYVWVDDSILVNREIIKNGYGMAYLRFSHHREQEFLDCEIRARRNAVGMWASPRSNQPLLEVRDDCDTVSTCYQLGYSRGKAAGLESAKELIREMKIREGQSTGSQKQGTTIQAPTQTTTETVYITRTGSKYHRGSCNYLRKSKIPISKADAIARGYGACSKCRP